MCLLFFLRLFVCFNDNLDFYDIIASRYNQVTFFMIKILITTSYIYMNLNFTHWNKVSKDSYLKYIYRFYKRLLCSPTVVVINRVISHDHVLTLTNEMPRDILVITICTLCNATIIITRVVSNYFVPNA